MSLKNVKEEGGPFQLLRSVLWLFVKVRAVLTSTPFFAGMFRQNSLLAELACSTLLAIIVTLVAEHKTSFTRSRLEQMHLHRDYQNLIATNKSKTQQIKPAQQTQPT
jgi:hypothetical protein